MNRLARFSILALISVFLFTGVLRLAISFADVGVAREFGGETFMRAPERFSDIPESVHKDAEALAASLLGDAGAKVEDFVEQLLVLYSEAVSKDFMIIFNSGGWGWAVLDSTNGWFSIIEGIQAELTDLNYSTIVLDYQRTATSIRSNFKELIELFTGYTTKARYLASRVEFLTTHIPDLKVIVAGESCGTVFSDRVVSILDDNERVYSIQTGPPFWQVNAPQERTLVMTSNGIATDTFSNGQVLTVVWATLKNLIGLDQWQGDTGNILYFLVAPGHDYRWQYPAVSSDIVEFLKKNFAFNR